MKFYSHLSKKGIDNAYVKKNILLNINLHNDAKYMCY